MGKMPGAGAACMPRVLRGTAHQLSGANDVVAMRITDMGIPNAVSILKQREIQRFQQLGQFGVKPLEAGMIAAPLGKRLFRRG